MEQNKALKILKENRQALSDKYGVKRLGVFPYSHKRKLRLPLQKLLWLPPPDWRRCRIHARC